MKIEDKDENKDEENEGEEQRTVNKGKTAKGKRGRQKRRRGRKIIVNEWERTKTRINGMRKKERKKE